MALISKVLQGITFLPTPGILNDSSLTGKMLKGASSCSGHYFQANNTIEQNIKQVQFQALQIKYVNIFE